MSIRNGMLINPQQVLIECIVVCQGGIAVATNPFNESDFLINRPIVGLQVMCDEDIAYSPIQAGLPVLPRSWLPYAFINIQRAGLGPINAGLWYKNVPLVCLRHTANFQSAVCSNLDMFRTDPMIIQWRDTNIAFPTPPPAIIGATTFSVPILITFLLPDQDTVPYRMAFVKQGK